MLERGQFILGPEVAAFERELAAYLGAGHAVGVANGTEAITIALRALGVGPGDEVVVPSFTFYASRRGDPADRRDARLLRRRPRDVVRHARDRPRRAHAADEGRHRRHLFGNVAPVARDRGARRAGPRGRRPGRGLDRRPTAGAGRARHGRDARRSTRRRTSARSATAARSRRATTALAERVRTLRFHGSRDKVTYEQVGYNSRLDELQAAILRVQLPQLDALGGAPPRGGARYAHAGLGELVRAAASRPTARAPAWHLYVVQHERADELAAALNDAGVGARAYYRTPIHRQPAMASYAAGGRPARDRRARAHASRAARRRGDVPRRGGSRRRRRAPPSRVA